MHNAHFDGVPVMNNWVMVSKAAEIVGLPVYDFVLLSWRVHFTVLKHFGCEHYDKRELERYRCGLDIDHE